MSVRVGIYDSPVFREHDAGAGHPERPERLDAIRLGLLDADLEGRLESMAPRDATREELTRVHTAAHVAAIAATAGRTVRFDPDTQAGPRSYAAALLAAGAACDAVDRVLDGALDRAFCVGAAARPSRRGGSRHGLLPLQQRGRRRRARPGPRADARPDPRLRRPPRQRHPAHLRRRPPRPLRLVARLARSTRAPARCRRSGEGDGARLHRQPPHADGLRRRRVRAPLPRDRASPSAAPSTPSSVLVSAGFDAYGGDPLAGMRADRGRLRRAGRGAASRPRAARRRGARCSSSKAATTSTASPAARPRSPASSSATPRPKAHRAPARRPSPPSSRRSAVSWPRGGPSANIKIPS